MENYTTLRTNGIVGINSIIRIADNKGSHFFDKASMRFFASRLPQTGYQLGDTIYFITSEQFKGFREPDGQRLYTIRKMDVNTGDIDTVGEFNKLTKSQAQTRLNKIIKHEAY